MERTRLLNRPAAPRSFQTTRWSVVRRAVGADGATAAQALAFLCEAYWYPLYAYVRRAGYGAHDAEDLTQGFFARLLEKNVFAAADPGKGKLRTYLLACVENFLADERARSLAEKRGAGLLVSFDPALADELYSAEPVDDLSPDRLFQRRWALTILEYSLELLAEEFTAQGKADVFESLRPFLGFSSDPAQRYQEIADAGGTPVGTLKNRVFRLRKRWRELLFEQVALTLGKPPLEKPTPDEIRRELAELLGYI
jgi:DNA-directed RNA polymerase specialized sigma24 family protein